MFSTLSEKERIGLIVAFAVVVMLLICKLKCRKSSLGQGKKQKEIVNPVPPKQESQMVSRKMGEMDIANMREDGLTDHPNEELHQTSPYHVSHQLNGQVSIGASLGNHNPLLSGSMIGINPIV
jgi:hypothetical protein